MVFNPRRIVAMNLKMMLILKTIHIKICKIRFVSIMVMVILLTLFMIKQMNRVTKVNRKRTTLDWKRWAMIWQERMKEQITTFWATTPTRCGIYFHKGWLRTARISKQSGPLKVAWTSFTSCIIRTVFWWRTSISDCEIQQFLWQKERKLTVHLNYDCFWQFCLWVAVISYLNDGCIGKQHLISLTNSTKWDQSLII